MVRLIETTRVLPRWIQRRIAAIAVEQLQLDRLVARPVEQSLDHVPVVRADHVSIADAVRVTHAIKPVAPTVAHVLITGESGTGKELVARAVHRLSQRRHRPLIKVNCASVPRALFESEFLGHVRGAFTGAVRDRLGRFQLADRGTLFLDEIGEIPLDLQAKLLRVLQEGEFEQAGAERTYRVDVRSITATNRDLRQDVGAGRFRKDLFYRLKVCPIDVPPLRDRLRDIRPLAVHYLEQACRQFNRGPGGAAELLGVKPTTLASRIKKAGLKRPTQR